MDAMLPILGSSKKVLLLGAGFVTRPTAEILSNEGITVTVACRTLVSAQKLAEGLKNAHPISLDVNDEAALDHEVSKNALVISLIPFTYHTKVIESAIRNKKHVVTTSYVSPAMEALNEAAKEAGITVMNEIGLDPGIDHLYAVKTISEVHAAGGRVTSFLSYCGGLPAPECSDNPLGYKFSWSSRGVLLALRNQAKFFRDGKIEEIAGSDLMGTAKPHYIYPGFAFWAYPNRDSTPYRAKYFMPEADTIIRGTLRYQGFTQMVATLVSMGFLEDNEMEILKPDANATPPTWAQATAAILKSSSGAEDDLISAISSRAHFADDEEKERVISGLRWIGVFSGEQIEPRSTPLDTLCATLEKKMKYEEGERDLVMLQHKFGIEHADGTKEVRTSTLCEYGDPKGYSAMAKLVGVPCAVAVMHVLDGKISQKGILAPYTMEIVEPLLEELKEKYGIYLVEKTVA
ncbi:saccharopine dehydrogenase (NADP+, L-glutamate-forming) [Elasticomyces elasticus]|nr:saccharopine dehydrogenase (NADP+, L-glutamate-forming) [Elasticomyces elasticus]KAK4996844.1 saccharopine dehydrogenase (NADP+, L-glutamate-forming) [Elasticomyces elasticus]